MPGRSYNSTDFRYGFNGKEKDDEFNGATGTEYDYGNRMYDARLGRFNTLDRLSQKYPHETGYGFAGNTPIATKDLNGDSYGIEINHTTKTIIIRMDLFAVQSNSTTTHAPTTETMQLARDTKTFVEGYNGAFKYSFTDTEGNRQTYDVIFDIRVPGADDPKETGIGEAEKQTKKALATSPIANVVRVLPPGTGLNGIDPITNKEIPLEGENATGDQAVISGRTSISGNKYVVAAHESIFHGIMQQLVGAADIHTAAGSFSSAPSSNVGFGLSQQLINNALQRAGIGGNAPNIRNTYKGILNVTGRQPGGFLSGAVNFSNSPSYTFDAQGTATRIEYPAFVPRVVQGIGNKVKPVK